MNSRTFVLIKPDGVRRGLIPEILSRFQKAGLAIVKIQSGVADEDLAAKHYSNLAGRPEGIMERNVAFISSAMTVAVILEGREAVARVRATCGTTEPLNAAPGTIRGDFGNDTFALANAQDRGLENLVHASDSPESARNEISLWFPTFPQ
jgi:nucleoside-diphosphate kinase